MCNVTVDGIEYTAEIRDNGGMTHITVIDKGDFFATMVLDHNTENAYATIDMVGSHVNYFEFAENQENVVFWLASQCS